MCHCRWMAHQRLHAPQALAQREIFTRRNERHNFVQRPIQLERNHPSESAHLPPCDFMAGMIAEPGKINALNQRMLLQRIRDGDGVCFMPLHSQFEGLQPAQRQPAIERGGNRASCVLQKLNRLENRGIFGQRGALNRVRVAAKIFCHAVDDDICAQLEGLLEIRSGKGVVNHHQRAPRVRDSADCGDVVHQ